MSSPRGLGRAAATTTGASVRAGTGYDYRPIDVRLGLTGRSADRPEEFGVEGTDKFTAVAFPRGVTVEDEVVARAINLSTPPLIAEPPMQALVKGHCTHYKLTFWARPTKKPPFFLNS